jgi:hypothetical protein
MDLIPASYRLYLSQLRIIRNWAGALTAIVIVCLFSILIFNNINTSYASEIKQLEKKKAISSHQRGILEELQQNYKTLADKQALLLQLRGGASAKQMFVDIDRALEHNKVWFTTWKFNRAGSITDEQPETVNTGYFIVVPAGANGRTKPETWKIQTHMEIGGQAVDHAALSSFVRRLIQQPQIFDVRVVNTQTSNRGSNAIVDFNIVVVVNSRVDNA